MVLAYNLEREVNSMGMQGTVNDWREDLLSDFETATGDLCFKARWLTAQDGTVCPLCAARDGKYFTLEELKKELEGEFCRPYDEDDRCRCCFIVDECCFKENADE